MCKAKGRLRTRLGNLAKAARFPHSHSYDDDYRSGAQPKNRGVWAMEKWKSKNRISTFPRPRQPAAARRKTLLIKTLPSPAANQGDTSIEVREGTFLKRLDTASITSLDTPGSPGVE
jgi:hypothetical protein